MQIPLGNSIRVVVAGTPRPRKQYAAAPDGSRTVIGAEVDGNGTPLAGFIATLASPMVGWTEGASVVAPARRWTPWHPPAPSSNSAAGYRQSWDLRIGPSFATNPLEEITRESITAWVAGLEAGPWAKVSTLRLLRSILELAVADGRIPVNPAALLSAPPIPPRERNRYLTAAQVSSLATALGDQGDVVLILAYTGLRWSELVGLRVLDVDLANRRLYVRRSAPEVEGKIIVGPPKTKAGTRTVPLPQIVVDALAARIDGRALDAPAVASPNGTMLRSNNWRRHTHWKKTLEQLKLEGLTIHGLRHTYASLACSSGADLHYVQKTMGRSSPTVTANIYADLYDHHLDAVADRLDRLIDKTGPKPDKNKKKRSATRKKKQVKPGGPGWDRTSDLPRVKRTLSH